MYKVLQSSFSLKVDFVFLRRKRSKISKTVPSAGEASRRGLKGGPRKRTIGADNSRMQIPSRAALECVLKRIFPSHSGHVTIVENYLSLYYICLQDYTVFDTPFQLTSSFIYKAMGLRLSL